MKNMPNYISEKRLISNKEVALMVDLNLGNKSLTNGIDEVAEQENVNIIIYKDSDGTIDMWSKEKGFQSLAEKDVPTTDMNKAIEIATIRYLN